MKAVVSLRSRHIFGVDQITCDIPWTPRFRRAVRIVTRAASRSAALEIMHVSIRTLGTPRR